MKHYLLSTIFAVTACCCAAAPEAKPAMMLDFGSAASPVYEGFAAITAKGNDKVKWRSQTGLAEVVNEIKRGTPRPMVYHTELSCDYITGNGPAELKLSVPPGNYKVWVLLGHPEGANAKVWNTRISTNSDSALINIFGTSYGNYGMRYALLNAAADKDGLTVRFDTANSWLVNAMVVAPAADWDKIAETVVAPLWEEYEFLPRDVAKGWKKITPPMYKHYPEPEWTEQQKKDGFALFSRSQCTPVWPDEFPAAWEINAPVRAFASQDEYETFSFSIHALRDFRNISLKVSGLVSAEGNRLPGELRQDYIRYMRNRPHHNLFGSYFVGPDIVMPWETQSLKQGNNLSVWLTAYVPPRTPPGEYKGTAELNLDGAVKQVPVTLKVLPIVLQKDPRPYLSVYYRHPYWLANEATDNFSRDWHLNKIAQDYSELQKTGFQNHPQLHLHGRWKGDRWVFEYDRLDQLIEMGRKYGFKGPVVMGYVFRHLYIKHMKESQGEHLNNLKEMPPDEFFTELTAIVREITAEAKNRNWPEILFYTVDEPRPSTLAVQFVTRCLKAVRDGGGKTCIATEPEDTPTVAFRPYLDVWTIPKFTLTAAEVARQQKEYPGTQYWCYPNHVAGSNEHVATPSARFTFGFAFWNSGFQGMIPWNYQDSYGDQWNFLDGPVADALNRTADDGSVIPSANWVAFREGLDDGRYIYTLERWIETARRHGYKDAAAAAEAELLNIRNSIPPIERFHNEDVWNPEALDTLRWQMAEWIMKLAKLVNKK